MNFYKDELEVLWASAWGVSATPAGLGLVGGIGYRGFTPTAKFCRPCRAVNGMLFYCGRKRPRTGKSCIKRMRPLPPQAE